MHMAKEHVDMASNPIYGGVWVSMCVCVNLEGVHTKQIYQQNTDSQYPKNKP